MSKNSIDPTIKSLYSCFLNYDYINGDTMWRAMEVHYAINSTCDYTMDFLCRYSNNNELKQILKAINPADKSIDWMRIMPQRWE